MKKVTVAAYAASLVAASNPTGLRGITGYNSKASAQFIQIHDAASLPADTAVPSYIIKVPADSNFSLDFGAAVDFNTGVVICNSSTGATKTIGSADCWITAEIEPKVN